MLKIRNIGPAAKFYSTLKYLNQYKKKIKKYRAEGNREKERENILLATTTWSKNVAKEMGLNINISGRENLPEKGPVVVVANHQGFADVIALCATLDKFQVGFVAKQSLSKIPLYGVWVDLVRCVLIKRESPRDSLNAIKKGVSYIKEGFSLVIFPEGTRSRSSQMGSFKKGSIKLATIPKAPIIPITINGTYKILEETGEIKPGDIDIIIHPLIETKGLSKEEEKNISSNVEKVVRSGLIKLGVELNEISNEESK